MAESGTLPHDPAIGVGVRPPMADPPAAAPAGVAMSGPGVLVATKLHMSRPPPGLCHAGVWWRRWARGWLGAGCWLVLRRDSARRRCWPTGPAVAGGRWRGWAWMAAAAARPGSGATRGPRWGRPRRGWPRA